VFMAIGQAHATVWMARITPLQPSAPSHPVVPEPFNGWPRVQPQMFLRTHHFLRTVGLVILVQGPDSTSGKPPGAASCSVSGHLASLGLVPRLGCWGVGRAGCTLLRLCALYTHRSKGTIHGQGQPPAAAGTTHSCWGWSVTSVCSR
jgi:hypothetical protein